MINLKYNKQTPCHVVGFVANMYFLSGIVSTFIFLSFLDIVFNFVLRRGRLHKLLETPNLFLLELACSGIGFVSARHLLVVKSLISKLWFHLPEEKMDRGIQCNSKVLAGDVNEEQKKSILGMNLDQIDLSIYI